MAILLRFVTCLTGWVAAATPAADSVRLSNGVDMPMIAAGTWQFVGKGAEDAVLAAIEAGYVLIDTAYVYHNQVSVGRAVRKSGVDRKKLFIETKVPGCGMDPAVMNCFRDTQKVLNTNLQELGMDYVDLVIIHYPPARAQMTQTCRGSCTAIRDQWRAFEEFYKAGKARAIGVSNYCPSCFECLDETAEVYPMVNQVQVHLGMGIDPAGFKTLADRKGVVLQAYSPMGNLWKQFGPDDEILHGDLTRGIAEAHGKSTVQVALKWLVQSGVPTIVKSSSPEHLADDLDLFSWNLTDAEMAQANALKLPGLLEKPSFVCSDVYATTGEVASSALEIDDHVEAPSTSTISVFGVYPDGKPDYAGHLRDEVLMYLEKFVWGARAEAGDADSSSLDIKTLSLADFRDRLSRGLVPAGAVVVLSKYAIAASHPHAALYKDFSCSMPCNWQGNPLLHFPVLQDVVAYALPLQVMWIEDGRCHFLPSHLPAAVRSHHNFLFAGEACEQVANDDAYFPIGMATKDLEKFMAEQPKRVPQRSMLFSFQGNVGCAGAKPRREALVADMPKMRSELAAVVGEFQQSGAFHADLHFEVVVTDAAERGFTEFSGAGGGNRTYGAALADSIFTLCPAGDVYDSYRILEAVEKGSIPVLEDLGEYRGCDRPATAFRALGAPFLYVQDWSKLPSALRTSLAEGPEALELWRHELQAWGARVRVDLKSSIVRFSALARSPEFREGRSWRCSVQRLSPELSAQGAKTAKACAEQYNSTCCQSFATRCSLMACCDKGSSCAVPAMLQSFDCDLVVDEVS